MAQRTTTSQRSGPRRGKNASSRNGKGSATNRRRSSQDRDGARPAEQALHHETDADREYRKYERMEEEDRAGPPDVLLDVPELKVDLIHFELDDLDAHVALKARVLNLVKLNVGVDVHLSRVKLDIKGVEAEVVLKARLDHVTAIVDRLMTSLDRNPELVKGLSRAVSEIGQGAGQALDDTGDAAKDVGKGVQSALTDVGRGAGQAVGDVGQGAGQAVGDVGQGAGQAVGDVGQGAGQAVGDVGQGAGQAVGDVGQGAGQAVGDVGQGAGQAVGDVGQGAGQAAGHLDQVVGGVGQTLGQAGEGAGQAVGGVAQGAGQAGEAAGQAVGGVAQGAGDPAVTTPGDVAKEVARKVRKLGGRRQRRAEKHHATQTATRVASELGIDLARLEGTGIDGRITVKDVRQAREV
jgi:e3 binding domain